MADRTGRSDTCGRVAVASEAAGREVKSSHELTVEELQDINNGLERAG